MTAHRQAGRDLVDELARERAWLRDLVGRIAAELERLGSQPQVLPRQVQERAMRVRKRLHEGVPADWAPPREPGREPL